MIGMSNIKASVFKIVKNRNFLRTIAFLLGIILQFIVVEIPFMSHIFNTSSLCWLEWGLVLLLSIIPLILHEILIKVYKSNL